MQVAGFNKKPSHQRQNSMGNNSIGPTLSSLLNSSKKNADQSAALSSLTAS